MLKLMCKDCLYSNIYQCQLRISQLSVLEQCRETKLAQGLIQQSKINTQAFLVKSLKLWSLWCYS